MRKFFVLAILFFLLIANVSAVEAGRSRKHDNEDDEPKPTATPSVTSTPAPTNTSTPFIIPLNQAYVTEAPKATQVPLTPQPTSQFKKIAGVVNENPKNTPAAIFVTLVILGSFGYLLYEYKDFEKLQSKLPFKKHL